MLNEELKKELKELIIQLLGMGLILTILALVVIPFCFLLTVLSYYIITFLIDLLF